MHDVVEALNRHMAMADSKDSVLTDRLHRLNLTVSRYNASLRDRLHHLNLTESLHSASLTNLSHRLDEQGKVQLPVSGHNLNFPNTFTTVYSSQLS